MKMITLLYCLARKYGVEPLLIRRISTSIARRAGLSSAAAVIPIRTESVYYEQTIVVFSLRLSLASR